MKLPSYKTALCFLLLLVFANVSIMNAKKSVKSNSKKVSHVENFTEVSIPSDVNKSVTPISCDEGIRQISEKIGETVDTIESKIDELHFYVIIMKKNHIIPVF